MTHLRFGAVAEAGRLVRHRGTIASVRPEPDSLEVTLDNGTVLRVGAVVNCTGPVGTVTADPLLARLARTGLVRPGPAGLGIDTADDGRVLGTLPDTRPLLAVGSLRRGNLWESTAMPEIREQAYDVARMVSRSLHGESRRRPTDPYGLTLSTNRQAAKRYNAALGRMLRLQDGVEAGLAEAVEADPHFVQAHAALALLGHEWGAVHRLARLACAPPTAPPTSGTSTTASAASSTPSPPACAPTSPPAPRRCCGTYASSRATRSRSASRCRRSPSAA